MHRYITTIAFFLAAITSSSAAVNSNICTVPMTTTAACPFCSAIALTFSEQMNSNDIAVVATLLEVPPFDNDINADFPKATFEIAQVLKGKKFVEAKMKFKTQLVGTYPVGQQFLVMGVDPPNVSWTTPMKASERVFKYLNDIQTLPESGPQRLKFFQDYFEDKESVLAFDAYDEFARAPYKDLLAMKDQMNRENLLGWIKDIETSISRRRLYFTMLGICGKAEDAVLLEEFIKSGNRKKQAGLDALIACYLTLKGEAGVDLIETTFLSDHKADYVDTLAAVSALRFHGTEIDIVPKERIVKAIRQLLDRPKYADMIIADLARWEDWSVMERLVKMFKEADDETNWLRVPVITYLRACPKQEAAGYIEELRKIDPEAVQRADFFLGVGESDDDWDNDPTEEEPEPELKKTDEEIKAEAKHKELLDRKKSPQVVVKKFPLADELVNPSHIQQTFAVSHIAIGTNESASGTTTVSAAEPNPATTSFVSTTADSMAAQSVPQVANSVSPIAPVAAALPANLTWSIIFIPMGISVVIFLLLWSVVNGWFERLIF